MSHAYRAGERAAPGAIIEYRRPVGSTPRRTAMDMKIHVIS